MEVCRTRVSEEAKRGTTRDPVFIRYECQAPEHLPLSECHALLIGPPRDSVSRRMYSKNSNKHSAYRTLDPTLLCMLHSEKIMPKLPAARVFRKKIIINHQLVRQGHFRASGIKMVGFIPE